MSADETPEHEAPPTAAPVDRVAHAALLRARRAEIDAAEARRQQDEARDFSEALERIQARAAADAAQLALRPCHAHHEAGNLGSAVDACDTARAFAGCRYASGSECPRVAEAAPRELAEGRLTRAGVPSDPARALLAALPSRLFQGAPKPRPLRPTNALRLVRAFLSQQAQPVYLEGLDAPIMFLGHERVLILGGDTGVGKTFAAGWAIREQGGAWLHGEEFEWSEDRDAREQRQRARMNFRRARLGVLDEIGEENTGATGYAAGEIAACFTARMRDLGLLTIATTNLERDEFAKRYGARVNDRLNACGKWVSLVGPSLRGLAETRQAPRLVPVP